jgi:hypothetical protein
MNTNQQKETEAILRVFQQLEDLQKQLTLAHERIALLEAELIHSDKGYELASLEDAEAFAKRRELYADGYDDVLAARKKRVDEWKD